MKDIGSPSAPMSECRKRQAAALKPNNLLYPEGVALKTSSGRFVCIHNVSVVRRHVHLIAID